MSKTFNKLRHVFRFKTEDGKVLSFPARVRRAKAPVNLILTAEDVRQSIAFGGVGNTQKCSMAVCAKRQSVAFPHPVEGYIDWQYSTAYVVSKIGKNGAPIECVLYEHSDDIAKVNDSAGGQRKLLKALERDGDRVIRLRPPRVQKWSPPGRPAGKIDGSRSRPGSRGAALRFATAYLGGVAA